jgi:hypothetical protein
MAGYRVKFIYFIIAIFKLFFMTGVTFSLLFDDPLRNPSLEKLLYIKEFLSLNNAMPNN